MAESAEILPGLPAVAGKPVHFGFDGGRLTSDAGILLLASLEQRLNIAERLAACLEDPRDRRAARICARSRPSVGWRTCPVRPPSNG